MKLTAMVILAGLAVGQVRAADANKGGKETVTAHIRGEENVPFADQPVLNVLLSYQAGIEVSVLRSGVNVAQLILRDAGVPTNWIICPPAQSNGALYGKCPAETDQVDVTVRILAKPVAGHRVRATATGMALVGEPGAPASFAYVYYDRVSRVADLGTCTVYRVLGHVVAHEIGHLLDLQHSWQGIMFAEWTKDAVRQMSAGYLLFHPGQVQTMRLNVLERIRSRRAPA
jgi:hypothetical protein